MTTLGRVGAPLTVVHPSQNSGRAASPVQAIEQASHDVISECRYTFCIARNSYSFRSIHLGMTALKQFFINQMS